MKRIFLILLCISLTLSLFGCNSAQKKSDELAVPFVKALLLRDEEAMKQYLHPDYMETALPNDDFYKTLEEKHFFSLGNDLTYLTATNKQEIENTEIDGYLLQCDYLIMSNEVYYDVGLIILDNDSGYGVIAVSMNFSTNPELYK